MNAGTTSTAMTPEARHEPQPPLMGEAGLAALAALVRGRALFAFDRGSIIEIPWPAIVSSSAAHASTT